MTVVVSNSSPLIALEQIGKIELLESLFGTVGLPPAVSREIQTVPGKSWLVTHPAPSTASIPASASSLGSGEREAIGLAIELKADLVILDERAARAIAVEEGLQVIGTLGILLLAKQRGLIPTVRPSIESLVQRGFFISPALIERVLAKAGEATPEAS